MLINKVIKSLVETHPELAKEAHGWDPATVIAGTHKKLEWKCSKGHLWDAVVVNRSRNNAGCPICDNKKLLVGFNDLATTHPEIAKEAHGWDPATVISGSKNKFEWKCDQGHVWRVSISNRKSGSKCPICMNQILLVGFNDLATTHPELAKEAHGWDPATVIAGTHKKLEWKCSKGHLWEARASSRNKNHCPFCGNQILLVGFNDLATTHPELAKEAHGWDPATVIAGGQRKWKCDKGHIWSTTVKNRKKGRNCPSCTKFGFNPNEDAYLYFLIQPVLELYQIGITNNPKRRLPVHSANGFEQLELRGPMDGHKAQELEKAILRYLKSRKADLSPEHIAGKFDGYSESWTIDSYKVNNLKELIDKASEAGF